MNESLAITEADAIGLADVAEIQLRLTRRFAERAEAEEDMDRACRLAHAAERAARGFRQSLLLKSKLWRDGARAEREAVEKPLPRTAQQQARIDRRVRQLYEAVEAHVHAESEAERLDGADWRLRPLLRTIEKLAQVGDGFADEDFDEQVAQVCVRLQLPRPGACDTRAPSGAATGEPSVQSSA